MTIEKMLDIINVKISGLCTLDYEQKSKRIFGRSFHEISLYRTDFPESTRTVIGSYYGDRFEDVEASWFRHRYAVYVEDVALMEETLMELREIYGIERVNANLAVARALVTIRNGISVISAVIIVVLFAISLFIISNTIKLATYERREEIAIMKMVGATNSFIRWPFVFEGCILGMLGSMSSFTLLWFLYRVLSDRVIEVESYLFTLVPFSSVYMPLFLLFASIGFGVGIVGSTMALSRYLKI